MDQFKNLLGGSGSSSGHSQPTNNAGKEDYLDKGESFENQVLFLRLLALSTLPPSCSSVLSHRLLVAC